MKWKGSVIAFVRGRLAAAGPSVEQAFLATLGAAEVDLYRKTLAIGWVDMAEAAPVVAKAARILYADEPDPLFRMGREIARDNLTGLYKVVLRVLTVEYAMKQAGALWRTYHDTGTARAERAGERALRFVVEDCDMPDDFRRILRGYIAAIIELTGARNTTVGDAARKGKAWQFDIAWSDGARVVTA